MTDAEFIAALENCSLPSSEFHHAAHVRAAYIYLRGGGFVEAIARMSAMVQRYAAGHGKAGLYHETVTVAFLSLINERLHRCGDAGCWSAFAAENPDLLDGRILHRYYRPETLKTQVAREVFVLEQRWCSPAQ
ncbi:MAG TPA: hypothetical protein VHM01_13545 [Alphaproteobacteria bacterium]|nr:hypothetical protein [Alphaproteobacteria bacterium]